MQPDEEIPYFKDSSSSPEIEVVSVVSSPKLNYSSVSTSNLNNINTFIHNSDITHSISTAVIPERISELVNVADEDKNGNLEKDIKMKPPSVRPFFLAPKAVTPNPQSNDSERESMNGSVSISINPDSSPITSVKIPISDTVDNTNISSSFANRLSVSSVSNSGLSISSNFSGNNMPWKNSSNKINDKFYSNYLYPSFNNNDKKTQVAKKPAKRVQKMEFPNSCIHSIRFLCNKNLKETSG
jgi:hypothetical protein